VCCIGSGRRDGCSFLPPPVEWRYRLGWEEPIVLRGRTENCRSRTFSRPSAPAEDSRRVSSLIQSTKKNWRRSSRKKKATSDITTILLIVICWAIWKREKNIIVRLCQGICQIKVLREWVRERVQKVWLPSNSFCLDTDLLFFSVCPHTRGLLPFSPYFGLCLFRWAVLFERLISIVDWKTTTRTCQLCVCRVCVCVLRVPSAECWDLCRVKQVVCVCSLYQLVGHFHHLRL
jgi:hypothetical protein